MVISENGEVVIFVLWGIDVVYGYGNLIGVIIFLYNIGLGVVNNVELMMCIGEVIVWEVCVFGIEWIFVFMVVVVWNDWWGRIYEFYFEYLDCVVLLGVVLVIGM